ncbi:MAG: hypothetical protein KDK99_16155 [Verrucomicrobiales bacterium]|nr:hypothetical protein [Verrucomicrobiales bacterium]
MDTPPATTSPAVSHRSWKKPVLITLGIVVACCGITAAATGWWVKHNFYASPLRPVMLNAREDAVLDEKIHTLESPAEAPDTQRTLTVSEKEINAFLARQGIGEQVRVNLGQDNITANFLLPIADDAPLFAGTTLRLRIALGTLMDATGKLVIKVNDVSVGGVPLPNAWLGDIKGVDLVANQIGSDPALQRFAAGIKAFTVGDESLQIVLNE